MMNELTVEARLELLYKVISFVLEQLEEYGCSERKLVQIRIAVEEIYVNIAQYAYCQEVGYVTVRCEVQEKPLQVVIRFLDGGRPYNPLERPDPDITADAEKREIGGLGIYMVKSIMDEVAYSYEGGENILTMKKFLGEGDR